MTDVASPPVDPLQPWPLTVDWRPVSGRYIVVEEIRLAAGALVLAAIPAVLWFFFDAWPLLAATVAILVTLLIIAPMLG